MKKDSVDAHGMGQGLILGRLKALQWARAAKAASRATAVLSAWGGPGGDADRDREALSALSAFARDARDMDQHTAGLACVMLWKQALKGAGIKVEPWRAVVDRAVGSLDERGRGRVREALMAARV